MEITFQNKREDFEAFYNYMVKETEEGKHISKLVFRNSVAWFTIIFMGIGSLIWAISGYFLLGLGVTVFMLCARGLIDLMSTSFHPIYGSGLRVYRKQEKSITPKELQVFQLPRTIMLDDTWLEIRSSEALHRWRWRQVNRIGITPNFIFIHVGNCPVVYVPKRDFPTEQSFVEFGNKLAELKEKYKDQPIGTE